MKTLQEEALAELNVLVSDEDLDANQYSPSLFGPCCTNGCQYCRPNCHEQFDSSYFF